MNLLFSSLKRLNLGLIMLQLLGNAALLMAAVLWLEIPDSHVWELSLSLLFGAAIVTGALLLHTIVIRHLRGTSEDHRVWFGAALLAAWAILLSLPSRLIDPISPATYQRASYWNSQLSQHMRTVFTYEHLSHWQFVAFDTIVWFFVPAILLPFVLETVSQGIRGKAWREALHVIGQWQYWIACIVTGMLLHFAVLPLVDWQPGHGVVTEIVSVILRLSLAYVSIVVLLMMLLAVTASLLTRCDISWDTALQPIEDHPKPVLLDE